MSSSGIARPAASDPQHVDAEFKVQENPHKHRAEVRLWLRLLTCANLIQGEIRTRLRDHFNTTLPRFDLMAQLERSDNGLLLGELSRRMMVSNGNVTGLVERLVQSGLIERRIAENDRRAVRVRLTPVGEKLFAKMAAAHAEWMAELLSGFDEHEQEALWVELGHLKASVRNATDKARPISIRGGKGSRRSSRRQKGEPT